MAGLFKTAHVHVWILTAVTTVSAAPSVSCCLHLHHYIHQIRYVSANKQQKKKKKISNAFFVCLFFKGFFLQTSAVSYKLQHAQIQAWHLGYNSYPCHDTWFLVVLVYIRHWRGGIYQTCRELRILIKLKIQWAWGLLDVTSPRVQKCYTKGNYANRKTELSDHTGGKCATMCWQVNITLTL